MVSATPQDQEKENQRAVGSHQANRKMWYRRGRLSQKTKKRSLPSKKKIVGGGKSYWGSKAPSSEGMEKKSCEGVSISRRPKKKEDGKRRKRRGDQNRSRA